MYKITIGNSAQKTGIKIALDKHSPPGDPDTAATT